MHVLGHSPGNKQLRLVYAEFDFVGFASLNEQQNVKFGAHAAVRALQNNLV